MSGLVLALVGTDHHPFDRLVRWMDAAASFHPEARFVVQYGASRSPRLAEGHGFLAGDELRSLISEASVVVCHGGPGTIMDAREAGHVPLCVPRDPRLGEHVDGHQQRFVATVGQEGLVNAIDSLEDFHRGVTQGLASGPHATTAAEISTSREAARAALAVELDQLMVRPRSGVRRPLMARSASR